jgi:hypothetical protein
MESYLLWTTRNGQRQWSGPYDTPGDANAAASINHHARETGYTVVTGHGIPHEPVTTQEA